VALRGWDYSLLRDRAPNPAVSDPVVSGVPVVDGEVIPPLRPVRRRSLTPVMSGRRRSLTPVMSGRVCAGAMLKSRRMSRTRKRATMPRYQRLKRPRRLHHHRRIGPDLAQLRP
jgi:hypothetical protein